MADDIVTNLRELMHYGTFPEDSVYGRAVLSAANEIERLRANLEEAYDACRYALADSPRWRENAATVVAEWEARRG